MTNGGIVHLAEMLRLHRAPENLLSFLPGSKPPSLPPIDQGRCGIYWLPNKGLSVLSHRFMRLTEEIKECTAEVNSEDERVEYFDGLDMDCDYEEIELAQQELERRRRHRQKLTINLGRTVSQQRIHVLATEGLRKSILWHCALRMLTVARTILLDYENRPPSVEDTLVATGKVRLASVLTQPRSPPKTTGAVRLGPLPVLPLGPENQRARPVERIGSPRFRNLSTETVRGFLEPHPPFEIPETLTRRERRNPPPRGALISSFRFDPRSSTFDVMFPAMHHPSANPLVEVNPPPVAAAMPNYPREVVQEDSDFEHVSKDGAKSAKNGNNVPADSSSSLTRNGKKSTTELVTDNYRSKYQFGLPLHLWQRIIVDSTSANSILHPDQQMKIIKYAASWGALEAELSINGAPENQQIWKILDCIDCFTYKPLS